MNPLEEIIHLLSRFPGVGKKSAARMAYYLLQADKDYTQSLGSEIATLQDRIKKCQICGHYSGDDICSICSSPLRDKSQLCVVEQSQDVMMIESVGEYKGLFHVLHGVLSPLDGIGPDELRLPELVRRIDELKVSELIIATNPTLEGDSTGLFIVRLLQERDVKITRIATGLPVGGDLEYADKLSISRALKARQRVDV